MTLLTTLLSSDSAIGAGLMLVIVLCIAVYFIPTVIAFMKQRTNKVSILLVNIFFGWSFIGWFIALIWAVNTDPSKNSQQIIINNSNPNDYNSSNYDNTRQ